MYNYYNSSSPVYTDALSQRRNYYQNQNLISSHLFYSYFYPIQPYYQTSSHPIDKYPLTAFNQYERSRMEPMHSTNSYSQYQSQYTWPYLKKKNNHQWKSPDSALPLATYSRSYPSNYNAGPVYQFEREVRYFPYPVYGDPGISSYTSNRSLRYPNLSRYPYPSLGNRNYSNYQNISQLPPKIRVIFIPPSSSCPQQPCNVTPAMPPFSFNRMSQPLCSLPLPPPLPQISSLPLTPGIQQMVMQKYSNPVAVLPFTSNYQSGQSFAPNYSFPPVVPPSNSSYPSTCRACVPAPPPLNIPVTSHCWIQHCSACHHIPGDASNPNVRPDNHGRMTPLLRQPTVAQHVQDANNDYQHYPHVNTYSADGSRSNNLPPLPPGAVIISDEFVNRIDSSRESWYSKNTYPHCSQKITEVAQEIEPLLRTDAPNLIKSCKTYWNGQPSQNSDRTTDSSYTRSSDCSDDSKTSCSTCSSSVTLKKVAKKKRRKEPTTTMNSRYKRRNVDPTRTSKIPSNDFVDGHPSSVAYVLQNIHQLVPTENNHVKQLLLSYDSSIEREERNNKNIVSTNMAIPSVSKEKDITTSSSSVSIISSSDIALNHIKNRRQPNSLSMTTVSTVND
ncbi:hypothetical protein I4U23_026628 [Adineta vaga]|nr:hypothetical protein I4U23_026628 [Adineta vaga]